MNILTIDNQSVNQITNTDQQYEDYSTDKECQKLMFKNRSQDVLQHVLNGDSGTQCINSLNDLSFQNSTLKDIAQAKSKQDILQSDDQIKVAQSDFKFLSALQNIQVESELSFEMSRNFQSFIIYSSRIQFNNHLPQQIIAKKQLQLKDQDEVQYRQSHFISQNEEDESQFTEEDNENSQNIDIPISQSQYKHKPTDNSFKQNKSFGEKANNGLNLPQIKRNSQMQSKFEKVFLIVSVQQIVSAFINKLKYLKNNRKIENLSQDQISLIMDLSAFSLGQQGSQNNRLVVLISQFLKQYNFIKVFMPTDILRIIWDIFQIVNIYIFFQVFSILLFFNQNGQDSDEINLYCYFTFILMVLDILINMNTAFFRKDTIIQDRQLIIKEYLFSLLFITDFVSAFILCSKIVLKYDYITYNPSHSLWKYSYNLLIFLKAYSGYFKKTRFENFFTLTNHQKQFYRLFRQLLNLLTIAHIASIGWYLIGLTQHLNFPEKENWLKTLNIYDSHFFDKYIYSLYWAVITMTTGLFSKQNNLNYLFKIYIKVGYGDIRASNSQEALYITINIILFSVVFAYSINNIGSILQDIEKSSKQLQDNIQIIQKLIIIKNTYQQYEQIILLIYKLDILLERIVRHYLNFLHEEQKERNQNEEDNVLSLLSNKLREEITMEANSQILQQFSLFNLFSEKTKAKVVFIMKEILVSPNEVIFEEGDYQDDSIYLIQNGMIQIYSSQITQKNNSVHILQTLSKNQLFGELSFFTQNPRTASARSQNLSTLYKIERKDFLSIIKDNQDDFEKLKFIQHTINFQLSLKVIEVKCYSCKQIGHIARNCPYIHQIFDKQFKIIKNNFSLFQDREPTKRRKKRSLNSMQIEIYKRINTKLITDLKEDTDFDFDNFVQIFGTKTDFEEEDQLFNEEDMSSQASDLTNSACNHLGYINNEVAQQQRNQRRNNTKNKTITSKLIPNKDNEKNIQKIICCCPDLNQERNKDDVKNQITTEEQQSALKISLNEQSLLKNELSQSISRKSLSTRRTLIKNVNQNESMNSEYSKHLILKTNNQTEESINVTQDIIRNDDVIDTLQNFSFSCFSPDQKTNQRHLSYKGRVSADQRPSLFSSINEPFQKQPESIQFQEEIKQQNEEYQNLNNEKFNNKQKEQEILDSYVNILTSQINNQIRKQSILYGQNSIVFPQVQQRKIMERLSKVMRADHNLIRAIRNQLPADNYLLIQQFNTNFERMQQFSIFFPQFNSDYVLRQYSNHQYQIKQLQSEQRKKMMKMRRPNIIVKDTESLKVQQLIHKYLYNINLMKHVDKNSYRPTNISYGIYLKGCKQYPLMYQKQII